MLILGEHCQYCSCCDGEKGVPNWHRATNRTVVAVSRKIDVAILCVQFVRLVNNFCIFFQNRTYRLVIEIDATALFFHRRQKIVSTLALFRDLRGEIALDFSVVYKCGCALKRSVARGALFVGRAQSDE